jgi:hypothetical protein
VIELSESDDEDEDDACRPAITTRFHIAPKPIVKDDILPIEDDPEELFPELAAQAREKARQREVEAQKARLSAGDAPDSFAEPVHDPVLSVFIQTRIPDTDPLLVTRKYSQNLRAIRLAWCQRQGLSEEATSKVFFTYRGVRVFDVASCKSLGITLDYRGQPVFSHSADPELADKLVLTATNQDIIDEDKRIAEAERKRIEDEADGIYALPEEPEVQEIKIFLKAKGYDNFRLKVKPVSSAGKLTLRAGLVLMRWTGDYA